MFSKLIGVVARPILAVVKRIAGPIASRVAAAIATGLMAGLVALGLEPSGEVVQAMDALSVALTTIFSFLIYGVVHQQLTKKSDPGDSGGGGAEP